MSNFKRKVRKNQNKKAFKVDIDSILDNVSKAQNENELQQCIEKHLAIYNGDKEAVKFALGIGCTQGMPLGIYVLCLKYLGYDENEAIGCFKYFIENTVRMGVFDKKEAEQFVDDCINDLNNDNTVPQYIGEDGQTKVVLEKDGVKTEHNVAQLVAETFVPNPDNLPYVRHINGDKSDNRAVNLEWCNEPEQ